MTQSTLVLNKSTLRHIALCLCAVFGLLLPWGCFRNTREVLGAPDWAEAPPNWIVVGSFGPYSEITGREPGSFTEYLIVMESPLAPNLTVKTIRTQISSRFGGQPKVKKQMSSAKIERHIARRNNLVASNNISIPALKFHKIHEILFYKVVGRFAIAFIYSDGKKTRVEVLSYLPHSG